VARFTVDPERSTITVVARPQLVPSQSPIPAAVTGEVEVTHDGEVTGSLVVTLDADPARRATIDLEGTSIDVRPGPGGEAIVRGRTDRAAATFGLAGSPLLNPTIQMRWHLVLLPG
jgi:hypothetical protein